ncbi:MAG: phosphoesterase PA-phosphatase related protein [Candidatus Saccharibacteria bacterium]|nr:phosphoesterase PA-phosphatase related protein [Candidatus Saccharibacteria bacterium]
MYRSAYSKLLSLHKSRRQLVLVCSGLIAVGLLVIILLNIFVKNQPAPVVQAAARPMPLSRSVLMLAEEQIRMSKPAPTEAAREYAYVASAYDVGLKTNGQAGALAAAAQLLNLFFPDNQAAIDQRLSQLANHVHVKLYGSADMPAATAQVAAKLVARNAADGHDLVWDKIIPIGEGKWIKKIQKDPFTPRAGDWMRWIVSVPITVPPPPLVGSAEDIRQLQIVQIASANSNGEDINKINFWGGTPGTDTPSGIWQNQLYKTSYGLLPTDILAADKAYSAVQSILAQTLSDSFMECWKVKYTYWTARPNMRDPSIKTAMDNPNFPGYVSGHSTISKAAADVLASMVPAHTSDWQAMAVEARDSRLKAGIHFDIDNQVGFDLGAAVAKQVIAAKELKQIL